MSKDLKSKRRPPGPEPERVKGEGNWEDAVKKALEKPSPPEKDKDRSKPRQPRKD